MNLRSVHAVLIFLSAALSALFGIWCLGLHNRQDGTGSLVAAGVAFALSLGLLAYDSWFLRKTKTLQ
jgi:hypothetical protein